MLFKFPNFSCNSFFGDHMQPNNYQVVLMAHWFPIQPSGHDH
jgi:hypothetical protein